MTFVGICFAFVNICQKKKEKREKNEKWDLCFIQKSYMYMYMKKSGTLVCNFFVSCDSRVGPTVQTAIFQLFSVVRQRLSKADKPKQNKTKIYKRTNEEYITHAQ